MDILVLKQRASDLVERYPYQFAPGGMRWYTFHAGWFAVFEQLCSDIDTVLGPNKHNFRWAQLKEKFGSARWYFDTQSGRTVRVDIQGADGVQMARVLRRHCPDWLDQVAGLCDVAEARTEHLCIACGAPGEIDNSRHWLLVLCPEHGRMRARNTAGWQALRWAVHMNPDTGQIESS